MSEKLLVPLDGSTLGERALPWAVCLARQRGMSIVLARVVAWPVFGVMGPTDGYASAELYDEILTAEQEDAATYLAGLRDGLIEQGLDVRTEVRSGPIADNLLDLADELGAGAIVMATHGRGGLGRVVLGSVVEQILQRATIPVLPVRAEDQPAPLGALDRLLVPLDGSRLAERALDAATQLLPPGSTLVLLQVVAPIKRIVSMGEGAAKLPDETATQAAVAGAEAYLGALRQRLASAGYSIETTVRVGQADAEIVAAATDQHVDLIVMVTHGRTGPGRWWLGSVADQVLRHAKQPIYLVSARVLAAQLTGAIAVADVMSHEVAAVRDDDSLVTALRKLLRRRISGAPVVDANGKVVGVITEHDLLTWQARFAEEARKDPSLPSTAYAQRLISDAVKVCMSHPAVTIEDSAPVAAALRIFRERGFRRLPVTRDGRLVGVIARADLLKVMAEQWSTTVAPTAEAIAPGS